MSWWTLYFPIEKITQDVLKVVNMITPDEREDVHFDAHPMMNPYIWWNDLYR
jgi:hypothetical protein